MEKNFTVTECLLETGLLPGSDVRFTPKNPYNNCMKCGYETKTAEINGILLGHAVIEGTTYDGVRPYEPAICPNCGATTRVYFIRCTKSNKPSLADQLFANVKLGEKQDDN